MTNRLVRYLALLMLALLLVVPVARACTGIQLKAGDGGVVVARTLEFAVDLESNILIIPRGRDYVGSAPGNLPGLTWKTKYGIAGANAFDLPVVIDAINEKGLKIGVFYFPGFAKFQDVPAGQESKSLAPWELPTFLLGTCANVPEAVAAVEGVLVGPVVQTNMGMVPPCHYIVTDATGNCVVFEYLDGKLQVFNNPFGVMTNSPSFDWHMTNLRNYINLSVEEAAPEVVKGVTLASMGQGSGMVGLPGDFTPSSRFVRAFAFSQSALPVATSQDAVLQAFHLLNQFDIPKGAARSDEHGKMVADYTLWTSAADLTNVRYYFHTYDNREIRMVDLKQVDLDAHDVKTITMGGDEKIADITGQAK